MLTIHNYPTEPPQQQLTIDVIIPFHQLDKHLLDQCLSSTCCSNYINPQIHLVADGCLFPENLPLNPQLLTADYIHRYYTPGEWGPFRIVNSLVAHNHLLTPYFAIQDVDDLSGPDRLWKQRLALNDYAMTTCAMRQSPSQGYKGRRHIQEPVLLPGTKYNTTPHGRIINSTRAIRVETFKAVNGFANIFCSADFQFDNRVLPLYNCHGSEEVLATRILHPLSLSNGREEVYPDMNRGEFVHSLRQSVQLMKKSPTIQMAYSLGGLDKIQPLQKIQ
jgi:hypothetical protein